LRYRNNFNGQLFGKWVWAFQQQQQQLNDSQNLTPRRHEQNRKQFDFPLTNDKTVLISISDQQISAAKLFEHV